MNTAEVLERAADVIVVADGHALIMQALKDAEPNRIVGDRAYEVLSAHVGLAGLAGLAMWAYNRTADEVIAALRDCAAAERAKATP